MKYKTYKEKKLHMAHSQHHGRVSQVNNDFFVLKKSKQLVFLLLICFKPKAMLSPSSRHRAHVSLSH